MRGVSEVSCDVAFIFADGFDAFGECGEDGGGGAKKGNEARCSYGSGTHGADVGGPELRGAHVVDGDGAGVERGGEF